MKPRAGTTLAELVLVSWLFAFVLAAVAGFAAAQGRLAAVSQDRARVSEALRTASVVLGGELRFLAPADRSVGGDSVRLRAIRGGGQVCTSTDRTLVVRYAGIRRPEPDKDSVLLLGERSTGGTPYALESVATDTACGGGLRLELERQPGRGAGLAMVFETGAYHLVGDALRYRRGAGGRQPLTEAILDHAAIEHGSARVVLRLLLQHEAVPRLATREQTARIHLANPSPP